MSNENSDLNSVKKIKPKDTLTGCTVCWESDGKLSPLVASDEMVKSGYCECPQCGKIRLDKILPFENLFPETQEAIKKESEVSRKNENRN